MRKLLTKLWQEESGQGMVEYGLILALVAVAAVVILSNMGGSITGIFTKVSDKLDSAESIQPE